MNSELSLYVSSWNQNEYIPTESRCLKYGQNKSPSLSWTFTSNQYNKIKSYALILQDISAHNYIHWYIPFIDKNIRNIEENIYHYEKNKKNIKHFHLQQFYNKNKNIKVKQGLNTHGTYGYFGPCPPIGSGKHEYIFYLFALDGDITKTMNHQNDIYKPKTKDEFISLCENNGIHIVTTTQKSYFLEL